MVKKTYETPNVEIVELKNNDILFFSANSSADPNPNGELPGFEWKGM